MYMYIDVCILYWPEWLSGGRCTCVEWLPAEQTVCAAPPGRGDSDGRTAQNWAGEEAGTAVPLNGTQGYGRVTGKENYIYLYILVSIRWKECTCTFDRGAQATGLLRQLSWLSSRQISEPDKQVKIQRVQTCTCIYMYMYMYMNIEHYRTLRKRKMQSTHKHTPQQPPQVGLHQIFQNKVTE